MAPHRWLWFSIVLLLTGVSNSGSQAQPGSTQDPSKQLVEAVVYTTLRPPNWDIYVFDKPGAPPRKLTDDPALDYNAVFSPDGRRVVFTSERTGNADLYALDLKDGGAPVRLTHAG
jgi:Tol biopolymer transport system component